MHVHKLYFLLTVHAAEIRNHSNHCQTSQKVVATSCSKLRESFRSLPVCLPTCPRNKYLLSLSIISTNFASKSQPLLTRECFKISLDSTFSKIQMIQEKIYAG